MLEPSSGLHRVVLVHGIWDTSAIFRPMEGVLTQSGFRPLALNLKPSNGDVGLDHIALQVQEFAESKIPHGEQFDLVGFRMGGLGQSLLRVAVGRNRAGSPSHYDLNAAPGNSVGAYGRQSRQPAEAPRQRFSVKTEPRCGDVGAGKFVSI